MIGGILPSLLRLLAFCAIVAQLSSLDAQTIREVVPHAVTDLPAPPVGPAPRLVGVAFQDAQQASDPSSAEAVGASRNTEPEEIDGADPLGFGKELALADVIASLYRSYPIILQARLEQPRTRGEITGAYGAYDVKAEAYTLSEPTGFYRNYRHGVGAARRTWWGGYVAAGYRIGRGEFQPWYQERPTNGSGEFKLAFTQPLLQGARHRPTTRGRVSGQH
jgi:hypothetical protein